MVDLKPWLSDQGMTVKAFALDLDVPLKTAQEWVYRGVTPSAPNLGRLTEYIISHCAHHWVIAVPNGPISDGVCQRCGHHREFQNSMPEYHWAATKAPNTIGKTDPGKPAA